MFEYQRVSSMHRSAAVSHWHLLLVTVLFRSASTMTLLAKPGLLIDALSKSILKPNRFNIHQCTRDYGCRSCRLHRFLHVPLHQSNWLLHVDQQDGGVKQGE
ncbi:hypothetical protein BD769DRAFT_1503293 [Suillus cothurnatus]|nr:hypothetical protein BD769DRAFT_1503293 [Suillus cothurnatus]